VLRLKDQRLEHRYRIERRSPPSRPVAIAETIDQPAAEMLEVHHPIEHLQRVAVLAQCLKMLRQTEKASLFHEPAPRRCHQAIESRSGQSRQVDAGVQLDTRINAGVFGTLG
jgi:hypothetical protein